jgi:leucyl aminopeptidase
MQIQSKNQPEFTNDTCIVVGGYSDGTMSASAEKINSLSGGKLTQLFKQSCFPEELGGLLYIPVLPEIESQILWVNCGEKNNLDQRQYQKVLQKIADFTPQIKVPKIYLSFIQEITVKEKNNAWKAFHAVQLIGSKSYCFKKQPAKEQQKTLIVDLTEKNEQQAIAQAQALINGLELVKNLANMPANICTPNFLAETAANLSNTFNTLNTNILDETEMKKLGMNTLLSVSQGSQNPAKLICIQYQGTNPDQKPYVFVGKGITFDTGGTCLKPSPQMDEMKYDMCGAATVLGLMQTIAELKLPLNVVGLAPCAENMPGSRATRPGDVVTSLSGKTIEILNTDAEGRLILCDTLTYAEKFSPKAVIDLATLTGAAIMTFGNVCNALMGNNQNLINDLLISSDDCNERTWQLPLWNEYQEMLKSNFADLPNIHADAGAKTIVAGCFLSQFTQNYPWAHLDIAGSAWVSGKDKGATGRPLMLLLNFVLSKCTALI